jgi:hypothetical protein
MKGGPTFGNCAHAAMLVGMATLSADGTDDGCHARAFPIKHPTKRPTAARRELENECHA